MSIIPKYLVLLAIVAAAIALAGCATMTRGPFDNGVTREFVTKKEPKGVESVSLDCDEAQLAHGIVKGHVSCTMLMANKVYDKHEAYSNVYIVPVIMPFFCSIFDENAREPFGGPNNSKGDRCGQYFIGTLFFAVVPAVDVISSLAKGLQVLFNADAAFATLNPDHKEAITPRLKLAREYTTFTKASASHATVSCTILKETVTCTADAAGMFELDLRTLPRVKNRVCDLNGQLTTEYEGKQATTPFTIPVP